MDKKGKGNRKQMRREKPEFEQKLLDLARVTRVVKGGRRFRFRATLVIGDRKGRVGVGVSKGSDVSDAIQKAYNDAKKNLITVNLDGNTISHDVSMKLGSAKVLLKPASEGRGIIAGGAVRSVVDLAGIRDIVSKSLGSSNKLNVARTTVAALKSLKAPRIKKEKEEVKVEETTTKEA
jgi:small subunit ribosomal protein S5